MPRIFLIVFFVFNLFCFSVSAKNNFAILYDDGMRSNDIELFIKEIKKEVNSLTLDWGYFAGRCVLHVEDNERALVPDIANLILSKGKKLYVNDGSGITLNPGEHWGN